MNAGNTTIRINEPISEIYGKWIFGVDESKKFLEQVDVNYEYCWIHNLPAMQSIFYSKRKSMGYFLLSSHLPNCYLHAFVDPQTLKLHTFICAIREIRPGEALTIAKFQSQEVRCGCQFFTCPSSKLKETWDTGTTHTKNTFGTDDVSKPSAQTFCYEGLSNLKTPWQGPSKFSFCEGHQGKCSAYRTIVGYAKDPKDLSLNVEQKSSHKKIPKKQRSSNNLHAGDFVELSVAIESKKKKSYVGRILFFIHCSIAKKTKVCIQIFSQECDQLLPKDPKEIFQTTRYHCFLTHESIQRKLNVRMVKSNTAENIYLDKIDYYCHRTLDPQSSWPLQKPCQGDEILIQKIEEILSDWEKIDHSSSQSLKTSPTSSTENLVSWGALLKEAEAQALENSSPKPQLSINEIPIQENSECVSVLSKLSLISMSLSEEQLVASVSSLSPIEKESISRFANICRKISQ